MEIIVTGHGKFASGIESTVKLLAGEIPGVRYIDFKESMSEIDLQKELPKMDNLLFFCDLTGGTPYKQSAIIATKFQNVSVISGCNVASLLEVGLQNDIPNFENSNLLSNLLIEKSHASIQQFHNKKYIEIVEEEGI